MRGGGGFFDLSDANVGNVNAIANDRTSAGVSENLKGIGRTFLSKTELQKISR
jgi:hypothetical protein